MRWTRVEDSLERKSRCGDTARLVLCAYWHLCDFPRACPSAELTWIVPVSCSIIVCSNCTRHTYVAFGRLISPVVHAPPERFETPMTKGHAATRQARCAKRRELVGGAWLLTPSRTHGLGTIVLEGLAVTTEDMAVAKLASVNGAHLTRRDRAEGGSSPKRPSPTRPYGGSFSLGLVSGLRLSDVVAIGLGSAGPGSPVKSLRGAMTGVGATRHNPRQYGRSVQGGQTCHSPS